MLTRLWALSRCEATDDDIIKPRDYTALGAGANVRACELEAPCSIPCRGCDTADLFHFYTYNEGPPWGPRMSFS